MSASPPSAITALPPLSSHLASPDSPSRVIIALSPLPSNHVSLPAEDPSEPKMLSDYMARLSRFEPRLRRYTVSKMSEVEEPLAAFSGGSSVVHSPPPGLVVPEVVVGMEKGILGGYSLVDLERLLLNAAPSWWKGKSAETTSSHGTPEDKEGLDVDLSEIFSHASITDAELGHDDDEDEVELPSDAGPGMFLNYYSAQSLIDLFTSTGILAALDKKGFHHPSLIFDTSDSFQHRLSLVDTSLFGSQAHLGSNDRYLLDLYMKRRESWGLDGMVSYQLMKRLVKAGGWEELREVTGEVRSPYVGIEGAQEVVDFFETMIPKYSLGGKKGDGIWDVTEIAWMQMHDPTAETTRPLLPGQRFPGLGLGREVASLMESMATESHVTDALLNFPFHYHNSTVYAFRGYKHVDPIYEAYHHWLTSQLTPTIALHGFCFVAWAISHGHLRRHTSVLLPSGARSLVSNRLERWCPSEQVFATGESMKSYLTSREYKGLYEKYRALFEGDGGAGMKGVRVEGEEGEDRKAVLVIDLEGCPELWKYSKVWSKRDPETGEFPDGTAVP